MILPWMMMMMMMMACCQPWLLFLKKKNIHISFVAAIAASSEDDHIIEQLDELNTFRTGIFIVHLPHSVSSRLFMNAKRLGKMSKGYAWIVTSKTLDHFDLLSSAIEPSMQGVIGFRSYIPTPSSELWNFTSRLRRMFDVQDQPSAMDFRLGLLAYDVAWSLAQAVEGLIDTPRLTNDLYAYRTSICGSMLLRRILRSNFNGLNGKLISKKFEIVNVVDNGAKRVGFCTSTRQITNRRQARMLQTSGGKIVRIGVPVKEGFQQLMEVKRDPFTNSTSVTGFCVEVFKAALEGLNYQVQYEFIPFMDAKGDSAGSYTDLINQKFDAVVGDTTITAGRFLFVDFTISFTDIGVGIVAPTENKDMWVIYKPVTPKLWLAIVVFHVLSGFVMWMIESQTPRRVPEGFPPQTTGLSSILVVRWEQLRNKWSIFIAAVSLFVLFILSSSYTATLASHDEAVDTADEYADALSKGSRKGVVSAILDEMPYIKIFLAQHSSDYSLIKSLPTTNGFAFVFPKGSALVPDISREIPKLRESGKLDLLENAWFKSRSSLTKYKDKVGPLTPENFGGLFLTTAALSVATFLMFQLPLLYHSYFHVVKNWTMDFVSIVRGRIEIFMKTFQRNNQLQYIHRCKSLDLL
ncbi:Detected protein of unknown function [Hibiscus syriacus]|uniref:Ionotropic glutamate receptor C-terminal domain-containing protein n=1 Tax=Hibiscus syriacus TaxID=106335 RepID=A0A6A3AD19_HIBSY|nr:Detected protein of unknown function [Hibiscus syriacus]